MTYQGLNAREWAERRKLANFLACELYYESQRPNGRPDVIRETIAELTNDELPGFTFAPKRAEYLLSHPSR